MSISKIRSNLPDFEEEIVKTQSISSSDCESNSHIYLQSTYSFDSKVLCAIKSLNLSIKSFKSFSDVNLLKKNDILVTTMFEELAVKKPCFRVLGRPALLELAKRPNGLHGINRYRYCNALVGAIVSVTGIREKYEMDRILCLICWMGGSFKKNINHETTHLVSDYACSDKSQYAFLHEIPVIGPSWLHAAWERRNEIGFTATNLSFYSEYVLKPFHGAKICFSGFTKEEKSHMVEVLLQNGGNSIDDENNIECTHLVTKESYTYSRSIKNRDLNTKFCVQDVLTPKNLIKIFDQENVPCTNYIQNESIKRTFSLSNNENNSHDIKKMRHQFLNENCNEYLFKHSNSSFKHSDLADNTLVDNKSLIDSNILLKRKNVEIVKEAWFWTSIQYQCCALVKEFFMNNLHESNISNYLFESVLNSPIKKKRKNLNHLSTLLKSSPTSTIIDPQISPKKQLSLAINSPDSLPLSSYLKTSDLSYEDKPFSLRHRVFSELLQTEINYVGALNTIITVYKKPLEEMLNNKKNYLLENTEINLIFGNILPIYELHLNLLEELKCLAIPWVEDCSIGSIFLKYCSKFENAYRSFVNFFDKTREILLKCDQTKPRFHAFLKVGQTKPECCRQSLQELFIRPVQRLPSISLLLNDILKHTNENNSDYNNLVMAQVSLREVMEHINEDKRKMDGQIKLFDIYEDIMNCPSDLVCSHRSFVAKCDVTECIDNFSDRGEHLTLFVFSDVIEICKRRKSFIGKSPKKYINGIKIHQHYEHIKLISLFTIKQIIDIKETENCHNMFSLKLFDDNNFLEQFYIFTMTESNCNTISKISFLNKLTQQVTNIKCSNDVMVSLDYQELNIYSSKVTNGTLGKIVKFVSNSRLKKAFNRWTP